MGCLDQAGGRDVRWNDANLLHTGTYPPSLGPPQENQKGPIQAAVTSVFAKSPIAHLAANPVTQTRSPGQSDRGFPTGMDQEKPSQGNTSSSAQRRSLSQPCFVLNVIHA